MGTGWVGHELHGWHHACSAAGFMAGSGPQPFGHFESPESKTRFASLVEVSRVIDHPVRVPARPATEADLPRVHTEEHLAAMPEHSANPRGGDMGDGSHRSGSAWGSRRPGQELAGHQRDVVDAAAELPQPTFAHR